MNELELLTTAQEVAAECSVPVGTSVAPIVEALKSARAQTLQDLLKDAQRFHILRDLALKEGNLEAFVALNALDHCNEEQFLEAIDNPEKRTG